MTCLCCTTKIVAEFAVVNVNITIIVFVVIGLLVANNANVSSLQSILVE